MERATTCCFTGHRPDKLPWGTDEGDPRCLDLKRRLGEELERAYEAGCRHFICGMANGCDLYFFDAARYLRLSHPEVTIEAAISPDRRASRPTTTRRRRPAPLFSRNHRP